MITRPRSDENAPPHDLDAEIQVLGAAINSATAADQACRLLRPEDFYSSRHQAIWLQVDARRHEGEPVELPALLAALRQSDQLTRAGGDLYVMDIANSAASSANIMHYAQIVRARAAQREAIERCRGLLAELGNGVPPDQVAAILTRGHEALATIELERKPRSRPIDDLPASAIEPRQVPWLWRPYLPAGKLTLLQGDPGTGKSFLTAALAAIVSRGFPWPDGSPSGPPRNVAILCNEDDFHDTTVPRLIAMGADLTRVFLWHGAPGLTLGDTGTFQRWLELRQPCLLAIDPIQSFMPGVDMHRANETRALLDPLIAVARDQMCAVVGNQHCAKASTGRAVNAGLGSVDFAAAARSILLAGSPVDQPDRRAVVHTKSSCGERGPGFGYRIMPSLEIQFSRDTLTSDQIRATQSSPVQPKTKRERAQDLLRSALADGPSLVRDLEALALDEGISWDTMKLAKRDLGVTSGHTTGLPAGECGSLWSLPTTATASTASSSSPNNYKATPTGDAQGGL